MKVANFQDFSGLLDSAISKTDEKSDYFPYTSELMLKMVRDVPFDLTGYIKRTWVEGSDYSGFALLLPVFDNEDVDTYIARCFDTIAKLPKSDSEARSSLKNSLVARPQVRVIRFILFVNLMVIGSKLQPVEEKPTYHALAAEIFHLVQQQDKDYFWC